MAKRCPIMSKQSENNNKVYCFENECAFWDEEMNMCCIKSAAIAVAGKKSGESSPTAQVAYIPARPNTGQKPQDYRYNSETGEKPYVYCNTDFEPKLMPY